MEEEDPVIAEELLRFIYTADYDDSPYDLQSEGDPQSTEENDQVNRPQQDLPQQGKCPLIREYMIH